MGGGAASAAVVEEGPGESPMREGWLACNFLLASERVGAPALRTTIAHSVTPKLAPFSLCKTRKTGERARHAMHA